MLAALNNRHQLGLRVAGRAGDNQRSDEIKRALDVKGPKPFLDLKDMENMEKVNIILLIC